MVRRFGKTGCWNYGVAAASLGALLAIGAPALGQDILPADFFNAPLDASAPTEIESVTLTFDTNTGNVVATGDVVVRSQGYTARGNYLQYNRNTGDLTFVGPASITDPSGNVLEGNDLRVTGQLRTSFIDALTITAYDGSQITADSMEYDEAVRTILSNARYAPCGDCIDDKGRRIGWSVRAERFIQNNDDNSLEMVQPTLELLGMPVAWLPYLWLPDLAGVLPDDLPLVEYEFAEELGHTLTVPYRAYSSPLTDVVLTGKLMSRQGLLLGADWVQRFTGGDFRVRASGVYQADPGAFSYEPAQERWRGMAQVSGRFTPTADWVVGGTYTAFSDPAYFEDYRQPANGASASEIYATNLTRERYFDIRFQQFNLLGDESEFNQNQQAVALPTARFDEIRELGEGLGQVELTGRLLNVTRGEDQVARLDGEVPDSVSQVMGFEGQKLHGMVQAGWQNQWVIPGGVLATPYAGLRLDGTYYDGASEDPLAPEQTSLLTVTPIAAIDVRWPLAAHQGGTVHIVEPVAQLVYRGSDQGLPGVTNDNAQSFVFDDTNLFSYNRFSGSDRQETGLRANVGGRYQANFIDGNYLEVIAGQSFQLAGANAFALGDPAQPGTLEALEDSASYAVLGAYAGFGPALKVGGKLQIDTEDPRVARAGLGASMTYGDLTGTVDYVYLAANADAGVTEDQHEIGGTLGLQIADYYRLTGGLYWDVASNSWLQASAGLVYDDGFLEYGANLSMTGDTHRSPNETRATATIRLKAPAGLDAGYTGAFTPGF